MDRFVPRDDGFPVTASAARQSMDRFVPRDDGFPVTASAARQSMDRFVPRDDGLHDDGPRLDGLHDGWPCASQITDATDHPGHDRPGQDRRCAIDASKIHRKLGRKPVQTFEAGIRESVVCYLVRPDWVFHVQVGAYRDGVSQNFAEGQT